MSRDRVFQVVRVLDEDGITSWFGTNQPPDKEIEVTALSDLSTRSSRPRTTQSQRSRGQARFTRGSGRTYTGWASTGPQSLAISGHLRWTARMGSSQLISLRWGLFALGPGPGAQPGLFALPQLD